MSYQNLQAEGPFTFPMAAAAIAANLLVEIDTSGNLIVCASDRRPVGHVQDAQVASDIRGAQVHECEGYALIQCTTTTVAIGDYLKSYTGGKVTTDGTSGATALTVYTIGRACSAGTTDGDLIKVFFTM